MTALIDRHVYQTGLTDLRQLVLCWIPCERDVLLASQHADELLKQTLLLISPGCGALYRFDDDAGIVSERVGKLQQSSGHERTCERRSVAS